MADSNYADLNDALDAAVKLADTIQTLYAMPVLPAAEVSRQGGVWMDALWGYGKVHKAAVVTVDKPLMLEFKAVEHESVTCGAVRRKTVFWVIRVLGRYMSRLPTRRSRNQKSRESRV